MSTFGINVYKETGATTRVPILVPPSLKVLPQGWSSVAKGGMWDAEVVLRGSLSDLAGLTAWLGYTLEIINDRGTPVWFGDISTIEVISGGTRKGISLDRMANRVSLRYSQKQPGGGAASVDTAWTSNTLSQTNYGIWERRISPDRDLTANEATALQATALNTLSDPHYTIAFAGDEQQAHIYCTGYWQRNKRVYHIELRGREEHNVSGTPFPLGAGVVASTLFGFSARAKSITSIGGYLALFRADWKIKITGSTSNNTTYTVTGTDERPPITYTSSSVVFSAADDIADANGGLGFIENDDVFKVAGSASNSGTHIMDKAGAVAVEINGTFHGGAIVGEAAGPTITFQRGNFMEVTPTPVNEAAGGTVTATVWGQRYYQTFKQVSGAAWTAGAIELRLKRVGSPADSVKVQLVNDSAGAPSTLIEEVSVAAASIPDETGWVAFDLTNTAVLANNTTYGLLVLRTGANDPDDFYEIDLDETLSYTDGVLKVYDGAAYQSLSPDCDLIFRVLGELDTGQQISDTLTAQSWPSVSTVTTSVASNQYRDGELSAYAELESLLDTGNSLGTRLIARVTNRRAVVVTAKPDKTTAKLAWQGGDRLTDLFGQDAEPGYLPAGEWVKLGEVAALGPWAALSPIFVERAEYQVNSGWSLEPQGTEDAFGAGALQG